MPRFNENLFNQSTFNSSGKGKTATTSFDTVIASKDIDRDASFDTVLKNFDAEETLNIDTTVVTQDSINLSEDAVISSKDGDVVFKQDIVVEEIDSRSFGTDTILINQQENTYVSDAVLKNFDADKTFSTDTAIKNLDKDLTASTDAIIEDKDIDLTFTSDAILENRILKEFSTDTAIQETDVDLTASKDTVIKNLNAETTYAVDTRLVEQTDKTASFDTVVAFGKEDSFTAVIENQTYTGVMNVEIETSLNELHTFKFDAFIEDDQDRQQIQEGKEVLLFDGTQLIFKGELEEVNYDSTFQAECEGSGQKLSLLKKKTERKEYTNERADDIIRDLLGDNTDIVLGTVEQAPVITIRVDHDNELRAAAGVANAVGYDLYAENRITDDYETTYVNFVEHKGSESSVATLNIAEELRLVDRGKDRTAVANDITILGRGDGINQFESRLFAATTHRTVTTQRIQAGDTTTLGVDDASKLGSIGDEVYVRVGEEVVNASIQDSTTLDVLGRGQDDYKGDETVDGQHYENIQVFLQENVTQGIGPFKPNEDDAEPGSSIEEYGIIEERDTDKTLIDRATVEKVADNQLKDRRQPVFRVEVSLTDPRGLQDLGIEIGDQVTIEDLTAPDVSNDFRVVGIDYKRASAGEETVLHCANRPVRLIERLSKIERDRDTLNAHMQGATNIDSETFSDNADSNHPLDNSFYIPSDVVKVNKLQLVFKRESFRGYVQNSGHKHDVELDIPEHSHDFLVQIPSHDHGISISGETYELFMNNFPGSTSDYLTSGPFPEDGGTNHTHSWPSASGVEIEGEISITSVDSTEDGGGAFVSDTSDGGGGIQTTETSTEAGSPTYGIYEPDSEGDVDVDVVVDGETVETITGVSVGEEYTDEISLRQHLSDPVAGSYHEVKLVPTDRCRLQADVFQKVFIESKL